MRKALFLDLDHTVIRPLGGRTFPKDADDWEWMPGMIDALKSEIAAAGGWQQVKFILVTNQGGVALGYQTEHEVEAKLRRIRQELGEAVGCPIHSYTSYKADYDRKPNPGMAYKAALEFELDLPECMMIGDMDSDREFAIAAGIERYMDVQKYLPIAPVAYKQLPPAFVRPKLDHHPQG